MNLKVSKVFNNIRIKISILIVLYSFLMLVLPRTTGYLTIIGVIVFGVYLFAKNQNFKEKSKLTKALTIIGLSFAIIFALGLTTLSPESLEQTRSAAEKTQIQK